MSGEGLLSYNATLFLIRTFIFCGEARLDSERLQRLGEEGWLWDAGRQQAECSSSEQQVERQVLLVG